MIKLIKKILPSYFISFIKYIYPYFKRKKARYIFKKMYKLDMLRYLKYSRTLSNDTSDKMLGAIVLQYHVLEKGLTMPETRPGFGNDRVIALCKSCLIYIEKYGNDDKQLKHAIGVLLEYEDYHLSINYKLNDEVLAMLRQLKNLNTEGLKKTSQIKKTKVEYFNDVNSSFDKFSNSRASVRNYTKENISLEQIQSALELARNTPSACNRQTWRTYIYTDKIKIGKILEAQGGNRGFGHLTNKLIIVTGELGVFCYTNERNQVFIDGGMYAMNLLYALHYNEIAACIMNCSFDYNKELEIKEMADIRNSEVLIAMVACGIPPDEFKIAISPRYKLEKTNTVIN
jgi:nitroreductase